MLCSNPLQVEDACAESKSQLIVPRSLACTSHIDSAHYFVQVPVGTTAIKRTTVPFLYNLNDSVEGLDVIDFPGVDDRDETIPDLAELLLALAQVVVFVVDYRCVHLLLVYHPC